MGLTARAQAYSWTAAAAAVAVIVAVAAASLTGVAAPSPLLDPGPVIRWGLVIATALRDLTGSATLGLAILGATVLPQSGVARRNRAKRAVGEAAVARLSGAVFVACVAWAAISTVHLVFVFADTSATGLTDAAFGEQLVYAATAIPLFQYLATGVAVSCGVAVVAAGARNPVVMGWVAGLSAAAWFAVSLTGHAAGAGNHELAVSGWWLHVLAVGLWLGGLLGVHLVSTAERDDHAFAPVVTRFSALAGAAAGITVITGVVSAALRIGGPGDIPTPYGWLVVAKVVGSAALLGAGFVHRRWLIRRITTGAGRGAFHRLAVGELVCFGAIMALAAVLSRAAPPIPDTDIITEALTPSEIVTGELLPEPLVASSWVTQWQPDLLWLLLVAVGVERYVRGVWVMRRRGDAWPWWRTAFWLAAMATLLYLLNGAPAVYGRFLFSAHMVQHMLLSMGAPLLLVLAAPTTLLLRACTPRTDHTMGPREFLLAVVHSPWVRFFANPVVASINFAGSILIFYFSPLFGLAISTHTGHLLMTVHFVAAGYLFAEVMAGSDPGIKRSPYPVRLLLLMVTMTFHAFFGVSLMSSKDLLASTYFSSLGWGIDLLADQRYGGGVAWGVGEIPTLLLACAVVVSWIRDDERLTRRVDRRADADREDYNAMLAKLAQADNPK